MTLLALPAMAVAHQEAPRQLRVMVQVIEVPHAVLTKWNSAGIVKGADLHESAVKLVETGEAQIVETSVVIARTGEKALVETIGERIYPTEYEPPELPTNVGITPVDPAFKLPDFTLAHRMTSSWETRDTGSSMEVAPLIDEGETYYLNLRFNMVDLPALTLWSEFVDELGDASVRMPEFETRRWTGALTLAPGVFELCTVFTPKPAAVPAATTRQMVFARCEVLSWDK
ncbi:hypothetical protein OKA04_13070 [Luteolibacter flavescens]|uniref:Uncharacterized protein n=1 Tax=Luteolibacter flavescens TaxID=1859460 RepID=A0ABT3FR34_9BACT|nr:hypothetical protein [Luteolibacter flavescens]MCW1885664.1 hypothetical protein [Luteolibacter flavescens]